MGNAEWLVTAVTYIMGKWRVELDNGQQSRSSYNKPPYKVGDRIVSFWHFDNYMNNIDNERRLT